MSDQHQALVQKVAELRAIVDAATLTPWYSLESSDTWTLHGEVRKFKGGPSAPPSAQILKAPKRNTSFAEYWPNAADSAFIIEAVNSFAFWLDWADDVLTRHYPTICGCRSDHFLCAPHRAYQWDQCPEIKSLIQALERTHR